MPACRFSVPAGFLFAILLALSPIAAWSQTPAYTVSTLSSTPANAALIQAADGNYYGTSGSTVFKMDSAGAVTTIYTFCSSGSCPNGSGPQSSLIQGSDGNLYGTTQTGGAYGYGVIYRLSPSGTLTVVHSFCSSLTPDGACVDGNAPRSLIQGNDGNFYGVTGDGGIGGTNSFQSCADENVGGCGTVFKVTLGGTFTTIHNFCVATNCTDGAYPVEQSLVQGSDGNFYGTTAGGGAYDDGGEVFVISSTGTFSVLYSFCSDTGTCQNGVLPDAGLVQGADGNFYGTTAEGGNGNGGTVFKITPAGVLTSLVSFCPSAVCTDGGEPFIGLFLAGDGNFYGGTDNGDGGLFQISPSGTFTSVDANGGSDATGVLQGSDGNFYDAFSSAILKVSVTPSIQPPVVLSFSESQVSVGSPSTLTWQVLNGSSLTLQQCYAYIQGSATGAGTWTGRQMGSYSDGVYSGSATITPTVAGTYTYALTCGGTESGFATLSAGTGKPLPTVTLSASPNPVMIGQKVTLTATVAGGSGTPTGNVSFYYGSDLLGTGTLNGSGVATYAASAAGIPVGSYAITAKYPGNGTYAAVTSQAIPVNVSQSETTVALTASPNPVTPPAKCTLTATVKRASSGEGVPTGTVTFYYKDEVIGTAGLNGSGVASVTASTSTLPEASYSITATYNGDASDLTSTSAVLAVTVE